MTPKAKKRYVVRATVTYTAAVVVEATSKEEARDIVLVGLDNGDIDPVDLTGTMSPGGRDYSAGAAELTDEEVTYDETEE